MSNNNKRSTSETIMDAAIDLISEKGYHGVTTEEIAIKSGFTEKTLFRHFQTKQNLLESAFHHYHYAEEMQALFNYEMTWDLKTDLSTICHRYHEIMYRNRKIIKISIREMDHLSGFQKSTHKHPEQLKKLLTNYFATMTEKGKVIQTDPERQAVFFMYSNYGAAIGRIHNDPILESYSIKMLIEGIVENFARALTP